MAEKSEDPKLQITEKHSADLAYISRFMPDLKDSKYDVHRTLWDVRNPVTAAAVAGGIRKIVKEHGSAGIKALKEDNWTAFKAFSSTPDTPIARRLLDAEKRDLEYQRLEEFDPVLGVAKKAKEEYDENMKLVSRFLPEGVGGGAALAPKTAMNMARKIKRIDTLHGARGVRALELAKRIDWTKVTRPGAGLKALDRYDHEVLDILAETLNPTKAEERAFKLIAARGLQHGDPFLSKAYHTLIESHYNELAKKPENQLGVIKRDIGRLKNAKTEGLKLPLEQKLPNLAKKAPFNSVLGVAKRSAGREVNRERREKIKDIRDKLSTTTSPKYALHQTGRLLTMVRENLEMRRRGVLHHASMRAQRIMTAALGGRVDKLTFTSSTKPFDGSGALTKHGIRITPKRGKM